MINKSVPKRGSSKRRRNKSVIWYLISPQPLTNLKIKKYYQIELKFNDVYSRNNLGAYVIHFDEYKSMDTHWIALYVNGDDIT